MNREIKFRVWKNNTMLQVGDGVLKEIYFDENNWNEDKDGVLMQYIGLKDKNGKEIYEGDMVNFTKRGITHGPDAEDVKNAEVWYSLEDCAFVFGKYKSADYTWWYSMTDDLYNFEVVGNIFKNPNLLDNTSKI